MIIPQLYNTRSTSRSKHIDVKFFFVKEKVAESLISIEHTPTTSMLVDPLTKVLLICVFQEHITLIGLLGAWTLCFSESFSFFMYFVRKAHVFSLLHAHFDVSHYPMILCHFDQMNDIFFLYIKSILLSLKCF